MERFDIGRDPAARRRFFEINEQNNVTRPGVPAFAVCGQFTVGFDRPETTGAIIERQLGGARTSVDERLRGLAGGLPGDLSVEA